MPHFPESPTQASLHTRDMASDTVSTQDVTQPDRVRVKNRRMRYLALHPEYFEESHLEIAGRQTLSCGSIVAPSNHDIALFRLELRRLPTHSSFLQILSCTTALSVDTRVRPSVNSWAENVATQEHWKRIFFARKPSSRPSVTRIRTAPSSTQDKPTARS